MRADFVTDFLIFRVSDSGPGIESAQVEKLFRPFKQADASICQKFGGTGLGLSLSRELAQLMGGQLELLSSRVGEGSVFEVRIPAVVSTDNSPVQPHI